MITHLLKLKSAHMTCMLLAAAGLGKKVAVLDFVHPSPHGKISVRDANMLLSHMTNIVCLCMYYDSVASMQW